MKRFTFTIGILLWVAMLSSQNQVPVLQWERYFDGQTGYNGGDAALLISVDNAGNALVSGYERGDLTNYDLFQMKINLLGDTLWTRKVIPDNFDNLPISQVLDQNGNLYILAYSLAFPGPNYYILLKYNTSGQLLWNKQFTALQPGNNNVPVSCLAVDAAGNSYFTASTFQSYGDIAVFKVGPNGDSLWSRYYNGTGNKSDYATAIAISDSGNVYVCGTTWNGVSYDYVVIKYNNAGTQQWLSLFDDPYHGTDYAYALDVDNAGNVYVTGESYFASTSTRFATVKYNAAGTQQWVAHYTSDSLSDKAQVVKVRSAGEIYVAGTSYGGHWSNGGTGNDLCVVKYNAAGQEQWVGRHNGQGNDDDYLLTITFDNAGNVVLGGYTNDNVFWKDMAAACFSPAGVPQWQIGYDKDSAMQKAYGLAFAPNGSMYMVGESKNDFCVLKYDFVIGIGSPKTEITTSVYPNPANDVLHLRLFPEANTPVVVTIFDLQGRICRVEPVAAMISDQISINISNLAPGCYNGMVDNGNGCNHFRFVVSR